jgi:hypothetical protein
MPSTIGNLTLLTQLDVDDNQLTGTIPPEIGNLTSLSFLDLSGNRLYGNIPAELENLSSLRWLHICDNWLFAENTSLKDFLDGLSSGWETCQVGIEPCNDFSGDNDMDGEELFILSYHFDMSVLEAFSAGFGQICEE